MYGPPGTVGFLSKYGNPSIEKNPSLDTAPRFRQKSPLFGSFSYSLTILSSSTPPLVVTKDLPMIAAILDVQNLNIDANIFLYAALSTIDSLSNSP